MMMIPSQIAKGGKSCRVRRAPKDFNMMTSSFAKSLLFSLCIELLIASSHAFTTALVVDEERRSQQQSRSLTRVVVRAKKKDGYRFGDISRGLIGKFQEDVNSLTGKKNYEFGDFTRWLDQKGRSEVGSWVRGFTNKPNYKVGDLSREVLRRLRSGEYTTQDVMLVLKIVALVGVNFQPIAAVLPLKVLIEMMEVSVAQDLSSKVVGMLTSEVDSRMKEMVTGDKDYKLGDMTKRALTGSKDYQFGDFTKSIVGQMASKNYQFGDITRNFLKKGDKVPSASSSSTDKPLIDDDVKKAIEAWDKKYLASKQDDSAIKKLELEVWDQKLLKNIEREDKEYR